MTTIKTIEQLEAHYPGQVAQASRFKEIDYISKHYQSFITASSFVIIATNGPGGLDCSPRGDPAGFVRVVDTKTLQLPDRRGNNRLDTLRNLIADPRLSLLFLVPGIGETIRVNGTAEILTDESLCQSFAIGGRSASSVLNIKVDSVYFQCQKAIVRSKLWDSELYVERKSLPSTGDMLAALAPGFDGEAYDENYPKRLKQTIY